MKEQWAEQLKEKLADYKAEKLPDELWAGIEQELDAEAHVVPFHRTWIGRSVAAVILLLVLGGGAALYLTEDEKPLVASTTPLATMNKDTSMPGNSETAIVPQEPQVQPSLKKKLGLLRQPASIIIDDPEESSEEQVEAIDSLAHAPVEKLLAEAEEVSDDYTLLANLSQKDHKDGSLSLSVVASGINLAVDLSSEDLSTAFPPNADNGSTGSPSEPPQSDTGNTEIPNWTTPNINQVNPIPTPSETTTEEHDRPVSIGLQVGIPLDSRWSITTGLTYTFTHSKIYTKHRFTTQDIQFVGIPVKLNYSLFRDERWNIYLGAGSKVDVGVYGKNAGYRQLKNLPVNVSLMASPGVQLNLTHGLHFYLEPSLQYNLPDAKNYHTYYSAHRWMTDLSLGFRWVFNR